MIQILIFLVVIGLLAVGICVVCKLNQLMPGFHVIWTFGPIKILRTMNTNILTDTQQTTLSVRFTDRRENPVAPPNPPVWTTSDDSIIALQPSADGLSVIAKAVGKLGTAQVTMTETLTNGQQLINIANIQVVAGDAVSDTIMVGTPVEQNLDPTPEPIPATPPTTPPPIDSGVATQNTDAGVAETPAPAEVASSVQPAS